MVRRRRARGYPLAQLVGLEEGYARLWDLYSQSVKPSSEVHVTAGYQLYESIVEALRPAVAQGVTSVLIATPDEKQYSSFIEHLRRRHGWLLRSSSASRTAFAHILKPASSPEQVRDLAKSEEFKKKLEALLEEDQLHIISLLEERLNTREGVKTLLFSMEDVEDAVYRASKHVESILVTERFRDANRRRIDRLLQIAINKKMKTKIIRKGTAADARISQFGGLLCILE